MVPGGWEAARQSPRLVGYVLQVYDLTHFTLITSVSHPTVQGSPGRLVRWGTNGLAFNTGTGFTGFVYLLTGGFVDGSG